MKAKITFEDETGKKKIVFNISEENNVMKIQAFALPPVEQKPVELMDLYEKLAGAFTNMITKK
jgi:hypothetical protein